MRISRSLNTRLVLSHLAVSLVSIVLMALFAGRFIFQAATAETEHNMQGLALMAGNALELPIQELQAGRQDEADIEELLNRMFADTPEMEFTVYRVDGTPIVDRSGQLPPTANRVNAPEVVDAIENVIGRGFTIRNNRQGVQTFYLAVPIQREIEVTGILRLGVPMAPTLEAARQSLLLLMLIALLIASGVSLVGWGAGQHPGAPDPGADARGAKHGAGRPVRARQAHRAGRAGTAGSGFQQHGQPAAVECERVARFRGQRQPRAAHPLTVVKLRTEALSEGRWKNRTSPASS